MVFEMVFDIETKLKSLDIQGFIYLLVERRSFIIVFNCNQLYIYINDLMILIIL